jgi:nucleoside-triphosphatase THEP1
MDEIGKLELQGGGFARILDKAVASGRSLVLAVRDINIEAVAEKFGIRDYTVHRIP